MLTLGSIEQLGRPALTSTRIDSSPLDVPGQIEMHLAVKPHSLLPLILVLSAI